MKHLIWYDTTFVHGIFQKFIHIDKFERYHKEIYQYGLMTAAPNQPVMDMTGEKHFGLNVRIIKNNVPDYKEVDVGGDVMVVMRRCV